MYIYAQFIGGSATRIALIGLGGTTCLTLLV